MTAGEDVGPGSAPADLEALIRSVAARYGMRLDVTDLGAVSRASERPSAGTAALARAVGDRPLRLPPRHVP
jgi:hypothetical protein